MLKVRVMGTRKDIIGFQKILRNCPIIRMNKPSELLSIKGTDKFYRNYMEITFCNEMKQSK